MNKIFLDNAGTTKVHELVCDTMSSFFTSSYQVEAYQKLCNDAILHIKEDLSAYQYELFFTSSGSEANNIALEFMRQIVEEERGPKSVLTTPIEHAAILNTLKSDDFSSFVVEFLEVDSDGRLDVKKIADLKDRQIGFATTMFVNNEIGIINPIFEMVDILKSKHVLTHVDAVQALGHLRMNLDELDADFISFSAHKIHGPKGIGLLAVHKRHVERANEYFKCRTLNVPYIMGFEKALNLRLSEMGDHQNHARRLKEHMIDGLQRIHPDIKIIGPQGEGAVASILNVMLPYFDGDSVVISMDMQGIAVSSGSACSSGAAQASHVIRALGYDEIMAKRCFRISTSIFTSIEEVDRMLEVLKQMFEPYV